MAQNQDFMILGGCQMIEQSRKLLQKYFGYSSFKAGQAKVIGAL